MYQIECEEKFFCTPTPALFQFIEKELKFTFQKKIYETDIYLKDEQAIYLQQNTCLRIRKSNSNLLELTSKKVLKNDNRIKIEKNYTFALEKEKRILNLLKRIGIEEYCTVFKERFIYTLQNKSLTYNIMIDILNHKTSFIELEIISDKNNINFEKKLDEFIRLFEHFNLKKTTQNYRDFTKTNSF